MIMKLSVCMPVYNNAPYLAEAIESVLGQSYPEYEFIIIDDRSRDGSADIIRQFALKDPRIVFSVNETNLGLAGNWNACLARARGEYVKFLFADDLLSDPSALRKYVDALDADPDVVLASSSRHQINERSEITNIVTDLLGRGACEGTKVIVDCLVDMQNFIGEPSAVIFRKRCAGRGFDGRYRQIVDLEMWFHILEQGRFRYIDEPLCSFRIHAAQTTRRNIEKGEFLDDVDYLLRDYAFKPYVRVTRFTRAYMHFAPAYGIWKLYKSHGRLDRASALKLIRERNRFTPLSFFLFKPFYRVYRFWRRHKKWIKRLVLTRMRSAGLSR